MLKMCYEVLKIGVFLPLKAQAKINENPGCHMPTAGYLSDISKHMHTCGSEILINLLQRTLSLGRFMEQKKSCDACLDLTV